MAGCFARNMSVGSNLLVDLSAVFVMYILSGVEHVITLFLRFFMQRRSRTTKEGEKKKKAKEGMSVGRLMSKRESQEGERERQGELGKRSVG